MTKEELIAKIRTAFKDFKLENGIGLWEGQGLDDYANEKTMLELRKKDERNNWDNIPYKDLVYCYSSLSFFDAKGMRFCLPKFLIFDILSNQIYKEQNIYAPEILFTLGYKPDDEYNINRFSLFDHQQIETIILFLEYKVAEFISDNSNSLIHDDYRYIELTTTLDQWKQRNKK
jgi:hypothetical protein